MENKKRILIVDDEQINLEFFDVMLSKLGFTIDKAENGLEALEMVQKNQPDLILLDNIMPKLSGWELTRMLKTDPAWKDYASIPIVMFSALDDVKNKVEGLELGADDYITKPFNFTEVLARIRAVLRNHDLVQQIENREERIKLAEEAIEKAIDAANTVRLALKEAGEACQDPDTVSQAVETATLRLDELDKQIAELNRDSENLRKTASDIESIRRRLRNLENS